jgi:hypothetical protein
MRSNCGVPHRSTPRHRAAATGYFWKLASISPMRFGNWNNKLNGVEKRFQRFRGSDLFRNVVGLRSIRPHINPHLIAT